MDGEVSQEVLTEAHAKNELYDKTVTPEQKASFEKVGITGFATELLWDSKNATKTPEGKLTEDTRRHLLTHIADMEEHVQSHPMDDEQKNKFDETLDSFIETVNLSDGTKLDELIDKEDRDIERQARIQKAVELAEQGDIREGYEEIGIGTEEDIALMAQLAAKLDSGETPTDAEIQAYKAAFAKQGFPKEFIAEFLQTTKFDEATQAKFLEDYTPKQPAISESSAESLEEGVTPPQEPAADESEVSSEESAEVRALLEKAQEAAKHIDSKALEYEDPRRLRAIWNVLERFNDRFNGDPERVGKFGLKIAGGLAIAIILLILWEISVFHKFGKHSK